MAKSLQQAEINREELYKKLPSVNDLILTPDYQRLIETHGRDQVVEAVRMHLEDMRKKIAAGQPVEKFQQNLLSFRDDLEARLQAGPKYSLRPVINATGVLLHTNLGRAPLSDAALEHLVNTATDYCNLELDLETGERSRRDVHVAHLLACVFGVSDDDAERWGVVVVNNCAAATFLALNSLAEAREVVVSRGELVEIGGGFRIPEILEKSGAILREVGTTNRTRMADYEHAVTEQTALLMRVHQSNFSIEGFVERPSLQEITGLAKTLGVPLFEDQGTGLVEGLERFGIANQPTLRKSVDLGVDLIAASGDKLLGGPQCGLLVGRQDLIARIRKNPLLRTFRVDKLTYAALEATLLRPLSTPLMRMIRASAEEIERRCREVASGVQTDHLRIGVLPVESVIGGGTAPNARLKSFAVSLRHTRLTAADLLAALRRLNPPIIARITEDCVLLDLRTVHPRSDTALIRLLQKL
jgi:L-seryl-tRNA(Ser) seleniumtransferase